MLTTIALWFAAHPFLFPFLFALSEAIGMLPGVQASSVFQAIMNALKWLSGKFGG